MNAKKIQVSPKPAVLPKQSKTQQTNTLIDQRPQTSMISMLTENIVCSQRDQGKQQLINQIRYSTIQREKADPIHEQYLKRIRGNSDAEDEIKVGNDDIMELYAFQQARDHQLHISTQGINEKYHDYIPGAIGECKKVVAKSIESNPDEKEQAIFFKSSIDKINTMEYTLLKHFYNKAAMLKAAENYIQGLTIDTPDFDLGIDTSKCPIYEATIDSPTEELTEGVKIANAIILEAYKNSGNQIGIFSYLAKGIQIMQMLSLLEECEIAADILEDFLKPKIQTFINTLPEPEQGAEVWAGKTLASDIQYTKNGKTVKPIEENDTWVKPYVIKAWGNIRQIVSPAVLNHAGPVKVEIDGMMTRPTYGDGIIHLGWLRTNVGMVMHEFGHHLEDHTGAPHWVRLQQLLHSRSDGGNLSRIFPFTIPYVISSSEMKYDAFLPASGVMGGCFGYNAKYYPYGSTEVVSTSFEIFHDKEKSYELAIRDPEMFIAVMAVLRKL